MPLIERKYQQWRADYVRAWGDMLYIDYNKKGEVEEKNAITCSEGKDSFLGLDSGNTQ
jgi:hypothetical protein